MVLSCRQRPHRGRRRPGEFLPRVVAVVAGAGRLAWCRHGLGLWRLGLGGGGWVGFV